MSVLIPMWLVFFIIRLVRCSRLEDLYDPLNIKQNSEKGTQMLRKIVLLMSLAAR